MFFVLEEYTLDIEYSLLKVVKIHIRRSKAKFWVTQEL
jgi:hypothetical protein